MTKSLRWLPILLCACATSSSQADKNLEKRYEALQREQRAIQAETAQVQAQADRLFTDVSALESSTGNRFGSATRCTAPRTAFAPHPDLLFGPLVLRHASRSFLLHDTGAWDTPAFRCTQTTVFNRAEGR